MRSAGATVGDGDRDVWLRVVVEDPDYQPACRWDGNVDANSILDVPKREVLRWADWQHAGSSCPPETPTSGTSPPPRHAALGAISAPQSWDRSRPSMKITYGCC